MNLTAFKERGFSREPHFLLLGQPVSHSLSPLMHNTALQFHGIQARYHAVELQSNELADLAAFLNNEMLLGANVTIPYKQVLMDYADVIDPKARQIGAINTIVKKAHRIEGVNTDCYGFLSPLTEFEDFVEGGTAIIFGTGGASRAIVVALQDFGVESIYLVSRNPQMISNSQEFERVSVISYNEWTSVAGDACLIINATPLGMYPEVKQSPVRDSEKEWLTERICYDIVYNPLKTVFLRQAEDAGAITIGGQEMLIHQAARSFELWTGQTFPIPEIRTKLHEKL